MGFGFLKGRKRGEEKELSFALFVLARRGGCFSGTATDQEREGESARAGLFL
jgi:hypothetical protein